MSDYISRNGCDALRTAVYDSDKQYNDKRHGKNPSYGWDDRTMARVKGNHHGGDEE